MTQAADREQKPRDLFSLRRGWPGAVVCPSGGVDSAVLALTFTGPHVPAAILARHLGVRHRLEPFDPLLLPAFREIFNSLIGQFRTAAG